MFESMIGIVEGFFGPAWPMAQRYTLAHFLKEQKADFYIYAPKSDPFLRKQWTQPYPVESFAELKKLSQHFRKQGLKFGLGFSPFELHNNLNQENKNRVVTKLVELNDIGIDVLGIFLDDMKGSPGLAEKQLEIVDLIQKNTSAKLLFCPTYYSDDPILDKVFGARPPEYLQEISQLPADVEIMWTGPKVLSQEMPPEHLDHVAQLLKRPPFIWDNIFANDGPKNCKFLKLFSPDKRDPKAWRYASGWALNPMNQAELAKINFLTYLQFYREQAENSLTAAVNSLCPPALAKFILANSRIFSERGLDHISDEEKQSYLSFLKPLDHPVANDLVKWLNGEFVVGSECLTD